MSHEPMVLPPTGTGERAKRRRAREAQAQGADAVDAADTVPSDEADDDDDVASALPPAKAKAGTGKGRGPKEPKERRRGQSEPIEPARRAHPVARWAFIGAMVVLVLAIPTLTYVGFKAVGRSNAGRELNVETDPSKPGYEAAVDATPTMLVTQTDDSGVVSGVTVLSLKTSGGGNVTFFPAGTELELPFTDTGQAPLDEIYQGAGQSGLEQRVETLLVAATQEDVEIKTNDEWTALVAPLGPLTIDNPVALNTTDAAGAPVAFAQGEIQVPPEQIGLFINTRAPDENDLTRLERQQAFWTAWLAAVKASSDPGAVPGETDKGLGRFVRGLAEGETTMNTLPVTPIGIPGVGATDSNIYEPDQAAVAQLVAETIPWPVGVNRMRARVLDGTGTEGTATSAAQIMVPAGAEIAYLGNADSFDHSQTVLQYYDRSRQAEAQRLLDALGGGRLVLRENVTDNVDVTVIVGRDFDPDTAPGASATTSTTVASTAPSTAVAIDPFSPTTTLPFGAAPAPTITPPTDPSGASTG